MRLINRNEVFQKQWPNMGKTAEPIALKFSTTTKENSAVKRIKEEEEEEEVFQLR